MKSKALKIGAPLALIVVIAVAVVIVLTAGGGAKKPPPSAGWPSNEGRPVSSRQIEALPPAPELIQVTNRLGDPERFEEARLASEVPQRRYAYYPVRGAERSEMWEIAFEEERVVDTDRCARSVVLEEGAGACSLPSRG